MWGFNLNLFILVGGIVVWVDYVVSDVLSKLIDKICFRNIFVKWDRILN